MSSEKKSSSGSLCILVVDDNNVNLTTAGRLLEKRGHIVDVASSGLAAVRKSNDPSIDLVLMDLQMPDMDGIEACAKIREREIGNGEYLPVVAMSAHLDEKNVAKCLAVGMDAYIEKPISAAELYAVVDKVAGLRQRAAHRTDVCRLIDEDEFEVGDREELVGIAQALLRVEGDMNLLADSAATFLKDCPDLCEKMDEAVRQKDYPTLTRNIDLLGSGVRMFSSEELQVAMEHLQRESKQRNSEQLTATWVKVRDGVMKTSRLLKRLLERRYNAP